MALSDLRFAVIGWVTVVFDLIGFDIRTYSFGRPADAGLCSLFGGKNGSGTPSATDHECNE
jgi:hypothetical protein